MQKQLHLNKVTYNRGVRATTTQDLLNYMDMLIFDLAPGKIFISIGSNDIGFNAPGAVFLANYDEILRRIREKLAEAKFYVMANYTINTSAEFGEEKDEFEQLYAHRSNTLLQAANVLMEQLAKKNGYEFINVNGGLTDVKGNLRKELTFDGVHMLPSGYEIVLKNMMRYL